jgi:DNA-binding response OmpR family regulator
MERDEKILLVEDDKFISRAYMAGLSKAGFEVVLAYDGEEAINKLQTEKPNIILLDLMMPVKDGFETLKEIKANAKLKKIPVVILSNLGQDSDIEKSKSLGATDYLIKSDVSMKEVIEKVHFYLAKA